MARRNEDKKFNAKAQRHKDLSHFSSRLGAFALK
jgi:hypothetical protein